MDVYTWMDLHDIIEGISQKDINDAWNELCERAEPIQISEFGEGISKEKFSVCMRVMTLRQLPYKEYLRTNHWAIIRDLTLRGCNWTCVCGERAVDAHHVSYERKGYEKRGDTIGLCRECHDRWHKTWKHRSRAEMEAMEVAT